MRPLHSPKHHVSSTLFWVLARLKKLESARIIAELSSVVEVARAELGCAYVPERDSLFACFPLILIGPV